MKPLSARDKIEAYFLEHLGEVISTYDLKELAGIVNYARRIRELRRLGWVIHTHGDDKTLKPGQYKPIADPNTDCPERLPSFKVRAQVLERDGGTCQLCGAVAGDTVFGRRVRMTLDHIQAKSRGGTDDPHNLRALCNVCNEGRGNTLIQRPELVSLLTEVRKASLSVQRVIFDWLIKKFGGPLLIGTGQPPANSQAINEVENGRSR